MDDDSNMDEWNCPRLIADLHKLKSSKSAEDPMTKEEITATDILILDNALGRILYSLEDLIDYGIHIDITFEIALARFIKRTFNLQKAANLTSQAFAEDLNKYIDLYINEDFSGFGNYIFSKATEKSDLLFDGTNAIKVSADEIIKNLTLQFSGI